MASDFVPGGTAAENGAPAIGCVVAHWRTALAIAQGLAEAGPRRIDGPFATLSGRIDDTPVHVVVCDPATPQAWYAAAKLVVRRYRPAVVVAGGAWTRPRSTDPAPPAAHPAAIALGWRGVPSLAPGAASTSDWIPGGALATDLLGAWPEALGATIRAVGAQELEEGGALAASPLENAAAEPPELWAAGPEGLIEAAREDGVAFAGFGVVVDRPLLVLAQRSRLGILDFERRTARMERDLAAAVVSGLEHLVRRGFPGT